MEIPPIAVALISLNLAAIAFAECDIYIYIYIASVIYDESSLGRRMRGGGEEWLELPQLSHPGIWR